MVLIEELRKTISKAKTQDQAGELIVNYLSSLDFSNDEIKQSGFTLISHFLEEVQNGEQLNLLQTKALVTTISKIVCVDYDLGDIKVNFRNKTPDEKFTAAFYKDEDKSITFFNDSQEFIDFMSNKLDLNTRLNIFSNDIVRLVAHELRHAVQFKRLEEAGTKPEDVNPRDYLMAKQFLSQQFSEIAPKYRRSNIFKQLYKGNHDKFIYEIDANAAANNETVFILQELSPTLFEGQINKQRKSRDENLNQLKNNEKIEWKHDTNPNNDVVNANHKASLVIDTVLPQLIVKDRKSIFEKNYILCLTYNLDGSKKSLEQVEREREANVNRLLVTGTPEEVKVKVPRIIRTYETAIESDPVLSFERCMKQIAELSWDGTRHYSRGGESLDEKYDYARVIGELRSATQKAEKLASYIEEVDYKIIKQIFTKCRKDLETSKKTDQRSWMFYDEKKRALYGIEREIMLNRDFIVAEERDKKEAAKEKINILQAEEIIKKVFPDFQPQNIRFESVANSSIPQETDNVEEKLLLEASYKKYVKDLISHIKRTETAPIVTGGELLSAIKTFYQFEVTDEQRQEFEQKLKAGEIEPLKNIYSDEGYLDLKLKLRPQATNTDVEKTETKKEVKHTTQEQTAPAPQPTQKPTERKEKEVYDKYGVKITPQNDEFKAVREIPLRNGEKKQEEYRRNHGFERM